jgi:hypothetical protein
MNIGEKCLYYRGLRTIKIALRKAQDQGLLLKKPPYKIEEGLFGFEPFIPTKPITVTVDQTTINNPTSLSLGNPCGSLYVCCEGNKGEGTIFSPETISKIVIGLLV